MYGVEWVVKKAEKQKREKGRAKGKGRPSFLFLLGKGRKKRKKQAGKEKEKAAAPFRNQQMKKQRMGMLNALKPCGKIGQKQARERLSSFADPQKIIGGRQG